jgi:BirA family transcriptional regulator, biotin operon repressor / biotin---[acetyl-CoA-carboxylase] ligase
MLTCRKRYIDRNELVASLANQLVKYLKRLQQNGFADFIEEWQAVDCLMHKKIVLKNLHQEISGKVVGINHNGQLLLSLADGSVRAFSSGDTSVKKN